MKCLSRFFKKKSPKPVIIKDPVAPSSNFSNPYMDEYIDLWESMEVTTSPAWYLKVLNKNKPHYKDASLICGVPWSVIGIIHLLESGGKMDKQILNGERWDRKTKLVPKGEGPFRSFGESCIAAFELKKKYIPTEWSVPNMLYFFEAWNGFGYRNYRKINTPYLWSFSNHYKKGKYVFDGKYDPNAVSKQCGAAVLLKSLIG